MKKISSSEDFSKKFILENISYSWKSGTNALKNCSLSIPFPGLWMLVGGNGSGKSTLFRLISGLISPQHGQFFCSFTLSSIAARVVDFPHPVGPVKRIKPLSIIDNWLIMVGRFSSVELLISFGIALKTADIPLIR